MADIIFKYFLQLSERQKNQFIQLLPLYEEWNEKVNLISRKDMDHFYQHHVLHSLAISKIADFHAGDRIMDLGTGGGFPGIPLAIMYPACRFLLVDSIRKKVSVVKEVAEILSLTNVEAIWKRAEEVEGPFDHVVTRAVAPTAKLLTWTRGCSGHLLALKGGDLKDELAEARRQLDKRVTISVHAIRDFFSEPFFETKSIIEVERPFH